MARVEAPAHAEFGRAQVSSLTAFERRALELFASGLPRGEIAQMLNRAPKTISNSLTAAKEKLGARSLAEASVLLTLVAGEAAR